MLFKESHISQFPNNKFCGRAGILLHFHFQVLGDLGFIGTDNQADKRRENDSQYDHSDKDFDQAEPFSIYVVFLTILF